MNRSMTKNAIIHKCPLTDYIRASAMALVVLLTLVAARLICFFIKSEGNRGSLADNPERPMIGGM